MHFSGRCAQTPPIPYASYRNLSRSASHTARARYIQPERQSKIDWNSSNIKKAIADLKIQSRETLARIHQNPDKYVADPFPDNIGTVAKTKKQSKKISDW